MKVGVVVFPGTNCDQDVEHVYGKLLDAEILRLWHRDTDTKDADLVVLPGGFSHGDYLRTGALAKLSPIMQGIKRHADRGGKVLGICNGFQILCEAGLLPGALLENIGRVFLSRFVHIKVERNASFMTRKTEAGTVITCPIAHFQGNYFADSETIGRLEGNGQVVFRYCSPDGEIDSNNYEWNVNGSINSIAGICNENGNVVGLMPHPERSVESMVGFVGADSGLKLFADVA